MQDKPQTTWQKLGPKIIEILITATISAGLAFLQSILAQSQDLGTTTANPELAGGIGASLRALWLSVKEKIT